MGGMGERDMNDRRIKEVVWEAQRATFDAESNLINRRYAKVADDIQEGIRRLKEAQEMLEAGCEEYDTRDSLGSGLPDGVSGD